MCLLVWIGTARPVAPVARPAKDAADHHYIELVEAGAPICARFSQANVAYVGSHEGCGCGYNSDDYTFGELRSIAEVRPLLDALAADERAELEREQHSRERLAGIVAAALADGPVEIYACWAGDESEPAQHEADVDLAWLTTQIRPLNERTRYTVRGR
jgi:hypothetical protein